MALELHGGRFTDDMLKENVVAPMKIEFNEKLKKLLNRKKSNSIYLVTRDKYNELIKEIKETKDKRWKDYEDYKMLANYDVLEINGRERLIQPKENSCCLMFYVATDELFGVLHTMHLLFNHANKDVLDKETKTKYCNISKEVIKMYLSCCHVCKKKL